MGGMNTFNDNDTRGILDLLEGVGGEGIAGGRPRASSGKALAYFWPPSGGIPAATSTSSTLSVGSALCYVAIPGTTGNYTKGTTTERVENEVSTIVGASGKPIGCTRNSYGSWTVVVEDCGSSSSTGTGGPTPQPDVGEKGSSSRSIDMGYSLGV